MDSPSSRALLLLSVLQTGRAWRASELSRRFDIADRTVRRDIARLRSLGYHIHSTPGPHGAYRLIPGVKIPPLLLDADEVCSLVTGLLVLEAGSANPTTTAVRAKLEQLLPPSLRRRAAATGLATQIITPSSGPADWALLGTLAEAVAEGQHLQFTYTDQAGRVSKRQVRPHRHILRQSLWYLVAFDTQQEDWRLFRIDRMQGAVPQEAPRASQIPDFPHPSIEKWLTSDFGRQYPPVHDALSQNDPAALRQEPAPPQRLPPELRGQPLAALHASQRPWHP